VTHFIWQEDKLHHRRIMVCVLAIELHTWLAKTKEWVKENVLSDYTNYFLETVINCIHIIQQKPIKTK
jgi:hypothetical protein